MNVLSLQLQGLVVSELDTPIGALTVSAVTFKIKMNVYYYLTPLPFSEGSVRLWDFSHL
jgi:hypothetical protein